MRKFVFALFSAVVLLMTAAPADAVPVTRLPDADLYCGADLQHKVASVVAMPTAASQWVVDDALGGHYVVLYENHYFAEGLLTGPVSDLSTLQFVGERSFGKRRGLDDVISCQIVSRFAADNFTIVGTLILARVN
jgi:hypothetical protein